MEPPPTPPAPPTPTARAPPAGPVAPPTPTTRAAPAGPLAATGGLAEALLVLREPGGGTIEQQMLQAAVVQFAPRAHMTPCSSAWCCWRWAAQRLLDDYAAARDSAEGLRVILDDELGQSAKQQLFDLQGQHDTVLGKWRGATQELCQLRSRCESLEKSREETEGSCREAWKALDEVKLKLKESELRAAQRENDLVGQLALRPFKEEVDRLLDEERTRTANYSLGCEKATEACKSAVIEKMELAVEVKSLKKTLSKKQKILAHLRKKNRPLKLAR